MRKSTIQRISRIDLNMVEAVPREAEIVETAADGNLICREPMLPPGEEKELKKEPMLDEEGNHRKVHPGPDGSPQTPAYEYPSERVMRVYKLEDRGTGHAKRNFNFRKSEEEKRREALQKKQTQFMEELAEEAAKRGVSPQQLIAQVAAGEFDVDEESEEEPAPEPTPDVEVAEPEARAEKALEEKSITSVTVGNRTAHMTGPGIWQMPDGSTERNMKKEAVREKLEREQAEHEKALKQMDESFEPES